MAEPPRVRGGVDGAPRSIQRSTAAIRASFKQNAYLDAGDALNFTIMEGAIEVQYRGAALYLTSIEIAIDRGYNLDSLPPKD